MIVAGVSVADLKSKICASQPCVDSVKPRITREDLRQPAARVRLPEARKMLGYIHRQT